MNARQLQRATRLYRDGVLVRAIADELAVNPSTLKMALRRAGVPPRGNLRRARALAELPDLAAQGMTGIEVARRYGVASTTVRRWARSAGIDLPIRRRRYPAPEPRVCALPGCDVVFTPQPVKVARGAGRYCSPACAYAARRGKVPPQFRKVR